MPKNFKQVVKGFRGIKDTLFRGSSASSSRKELLFRSMHPDLQGHDVAFQRDEVLNCKWLFY